MKLHTLILVFHLNRILSIVLLLLLYAITLAQPDRNIDSLSSAINGMVDDTGKVIAFIRLGQLCVEQSLIDEGSDYLNRAVTLGKNLRFNQGVLRAYTGLGIVNLQQGKLNEAEHFLKMALDMAKEANDRYRSLRAHTELGTVYRDMGNHEEALKHYLAALDLAEELKDANEISFIYTMIGIMYDYRGDYPKALEFYLESLKAAEKYGDQFGIARAKQNMAIIYHYEHDLDKSLKLHQEVLMIWKEIKNNQGIADEYDNIGEIYLNQCDLDEALKSTMQGLNWSEEIKYSTGIGTAHDILGSIYMARNEYSNALKHYMLAGDVWKNSGSLEKMANTNNSIGSAYYALNRLKEASQYFNKALLIASQWGNLLNMADSYGKLSEVEERLGNYQNALSYYKLLVQTTDSLNSENKRQQLTEIKEKYESDTKDKEIELLNKEKSLQKLEVKKQRQAKNYFMASLVLLIFLSFFIYRNYTTREKLKLLTLRNKIASDLHDDVGSTLSSISIFSQMALAHSGEINAALETIGESSRKMLDAMADIVWTINPENDQFEKIIQRMRGFAYELLGAKQIEFDFEADEEISEYKLPMDARKNLYLIFKEATNNLVKYADANKAYFALKAEKDKMTMTIRDDGKGFDTTRETMGNGLKNMKKRAAEIGAHLKIDSGPKLGTTIKLELAI